MTNPTTATSNIRVGLLSLLLATPAAVVYATPNFMNRIPNGAGKVQLADGTSWMAIGHQTPNQGGPLNPFGADFKAAGLTWTVALCQLDSDGDGRTNGQELGDPDCVWTRGSTPAVQVGITHPGLFNEEFAAMVEEEENNTMGSGIEEEKGNPAAGVEPTKEQDDLLAQKPPQEQDNQEENLQNAAQQQTPTNTKPTMLRLAPWLQAHIACMMLSWGFFLPLGALVAISFRNSSTAHWFHVHVSLQVIGTILNLVGFVLPMIHVATHFQGGHPILGTIVFALGMAQALQGFLRPAKPATKTETPSTLRRIWEVVHKGLGRLVIVLAWINIFMGVRLVKSFYKNVPGNDRVITMCQALLGVQGVICVVLTIVSVFYKKDKNKKSEEEEDDEKSDVMNNTARGSLEMDSSSLRV